MTARTSIVLDRITISNTSVFNRLGSEAAEARSERIFHIADRGTHQDRVNSMDDELVKSIRDYVFASREVMALDDDKAEKLRLLVADRFNLPRNHVWWWESLPKAAVCLSYGGGDEGLERLSTVLPAGASLRLFATDDSLPPWPCVCGTSTALIDMLREQRFFEYFIVDPELNWIVFDTHHNVLMAYGHGLRILDGH